MAAGVAASASNTEQKGSPVGKVIELIDELKVKVQKDLAAEEKAMAKTQTQADMMTSEPEI